MIEREFAAQQVARLSGLVGFPADLTPQAELVSALTQAPDERTARKAIDEWLSEERYAPTPADITALLRRLQFGETMYTQWEPVLDPCPRCSGTGWEPVEMGDGYSGVRRCACRRKQAAEAAASGKEAAAGRDG